VNVALGHDSLLSAGEALVEGGVVDVLVKEIKTILEPIDSLTNMLHIPVSFKSSWSFKSTHIPAGRVLAAEASLHKMSRMISLLGEDVKISAQALLRQDVARPDGMQVVSVMVVIMGMKMAVAMVLGGVPVPGQAVPVVGSLVVMAMMGRAVPVIVRFSVLAVVHLVVSMAMLLVMTMTMTLAVSVTVSLIMSMPMTMAFIVSMAMRLVMTMVMSMSVMTLMMVLMATMVMIPMIDIASSEWAIKHPAPRTRSDLWSLFVLKETKRANSDLCFGSTNKRVILILVVEKGDESHDRERERQERRKGESHLHDESRSRNKQECIASEGGMDRG
jgi:hypothetical protein